MSRFVAFMLVWLMGLTLGIPLGMLIDMLITKWSERIVRKLFGRWLDTWEPRP